MQTETVAEIEYPSSDGEPLAETDVHVMAILLLISAVRGHFRNRPDVYAIGNVFWYYEEGNPKARKAPDLMVIKGVDGQRQRNSFKSWVERAVPCFIFEITSKGTADEDEVNKFDLYQRLGVREYFLFDPLNEYLDEQLIGYRLVGGKYEKLEAADDGAVTSEELGLRAVPEGVRVALFDVRTGRRAAHFADAYENYDELTGRVEDAERRAETAEERLDRAKKEAARAKQQAAEARQQIDEAKRQAEEDARRADEADQRAQVAKRQAEEDARRADEANQRAEALAAELERLRRLLPPAN